MFWRYKTSHCIHYWTITRKWQNANLEIVIKFYLFFFASVYLYWKAASWSLHCQSSLLDHPRAVQGAERQSFLKYKFKKDQGFSRWFKNEVERGLEQRNLLNLTLVSARQRVGWRKKLTPSLIQISFIKEIAKYWSVKIPC